MANSFMCVTRGVLVPAALISLAFSAGCASQSPPDHHGAFRPPPAPLGSSGPPAGATMGAGQEPGNEPTGGETPGNGSPESEPSVNIVRYIGLDRTRWPASVAPADLAGLYTRVEVEAPSDTAGAWAPGSTRSYALEKRGVVARLFSSRTIAITASANATVKDPDLTASLPLFSISHDSSRGGGEVFVTSYTSSHVEEPLFRIGPNTTLTIRLNAKVSDHHKTSLTADLIRAVETAVNIAAPTSTILTSLSKTDVANASTAIDSVIGGLSSQDLTEAVELGRLMDTWREGAEVEVEAKVPSGLIRVEGDRSTAGDDALVGSWSIRISCPRPSIFDPRDLCAHGVGAPFDTAALPGLKKLILASASPSQILQTHLSSQVTIEAFVQSQSWYSTFLQRTHKVAKDTHDLCASALTSLYAVGLSDFDAALVLRAMGRQMPGFADLDPAVALPKQCGDLMPPDVPLS